MIEIRKFGPFKHGAVENFTRADIEFYGIDHFRPSYHARVFLNDSDITHDNSDVSRDSYAGSFSMFGHAICYGSKGHCDVPKEIRRFDDRPSHPLTPAFKRVTVTEALRKAIKQGDELTLTVVVESAEEWDNKEKGPLLSFRDMQLVTFD